MRIVRDANRARQRNALEPRSDIDAVTEHVVVVEDDVADMNADAEFDLQLRRHTSIVFGHCALHVHREAHRVDGAGELDKHTVPGGLDDAAAMRGNAGIDNGPAQHLELSQRAFLVAAHQPAVTGDVGRQHCR